MASDSRKLMAEKDQQVPLLAWFLMEVIGAAFTVVNVYSGKAGPAARCCARAEAPAHTRAAAKSINFFIASLKLVFIYKYNKRMAESCHPSEKCLGISPD